MSFWLYLKERWLFFLFQGMLLGFFCLMLNVLHQGWEMQLLIVSSGVLITVGAVVVEFLPRKRYISSLNHTLENLDQKQLLLELVDRPEYLEGQQFYEVLRVVTKSMNDQIAAYEISQEEYRQYVETWVHEIKTPIATAELICKNNPGDWQKQLQLELERIKDNVEQALYYARSVATEKDTVIRAEQLDTIVHQAVKAHARQLISLRCKLVFEGLDRRVYTDAKWLSFIIGQLICNSIQYHQLPMQLEFSATENNDSIILSIKDNGIGIPRCDLPRIFDKGFTGTNGRQYGKATGIGLYLCAVLCNKLNTQITAASKVDEGTCFCIYFPKNKLILLDER